MEALENICKAEEEVEDVSLISYIPSIFQCCIGSELFTIAYAVAYTVAYAVAYALAYALAYAVVY